MGITYIFRLTKLDNEIIVLYMMKETKTMTTNQKIQRLEQSIKLQEHTRKNLLKMNAPTPEALELTSRIIAQLRAQIQILKGF